jgi:hypothetical protein
MIFLDIISRLETIYRVVVALLLYNEHGASKRVCIRVS